MDLIVVKDVDERARQLVNRLIAKGISASIWRDKAVDDHLPWVDGRMLRLHPCTLVLSPATPPEQVQEAVEAVAPTSVVIGGMVLPATLLAASKKNVAYHNILQDEAYCVLNAIPTAEGALLLALQNTPYAIHGANVSVLGFGRVGRAVATCFAGVGAKITVISQESAECAWAEVHYLDSIELCQLKKVLPMTQILINSIPALVVKEEDLRLLPQDALVLDLASGKGGIDHEAAEKHQIKCIHALSLPGKVAPQTAAMHMEEAILRHLKIKER